MDDTKRQAVQYAAEELRDALDSVESRRDVLRAAMHNAEITDDAVQWNGLGTVAFTVVWPADRLYPNKADVLDALARRLRYLESMSDGEILEAVGPIDDIFLDIDS